MLNLQYGIVTSNGVSFVHLAQYAVRETRLRKARTPMASGLFTTEDEARAYMLTISEVLEEEYRKAMEDYQSSHPEWRNSRYGEQWLKGINVRHAQTFRIAKIVVELL